jgi:Ca2+-binding EF-hand superfamily protein
LKDCFTAFDTDNDGLISKKDMATCIRALGELSLQEVNSAYYSVIAFVNDFYGSI